MLHKNVIKNLYENYLNHCDIINNVRISNPIIRVRRNGFPDIVSEHLVLYALLGNNINNYEYTWNTAGDLKKTKDDEIKKIEIKCTSSSGPLSFGPTQHWDDLYICDASDFTNDRIKIYYIKCNKDTFQNIKVNKKQKFKDQCLQKRRPRISLDGILAQLNEENDYDTVYDGSILDLLIP